MDWDALWNIPFDPLRYTNLGRVEVSFEGAGKIQMRRIAYLFFKVLLLITDGRQSRDNDAVPLDTAVLPLRRQGVNVVVVGIGRSIDPRELRLLAGDPNNVVVSKSFEDLNRFVKRLIAKSCER